MTDPTPAPRSGGDEEPRTEAGRALLRRLDRIPRTYALISDRGAWADDIIAIEREAATPPSPAAEPPFGRDVSWAGPLAGRLEAIMDREYPPSPAAGGLRTEADAALLDAVRAYGDARADVAYGRATRKAIDLAWQRLLDVGRLPEMDADTRQVRAALASGASSETAGLREAAEALEAKLASIAYGRIDLEFPWEAEWKALRARLAASGIAERAGEDRE